MALSGVALAALFTVRRKKPRRSRPVRAILLLLLVELRAGRSVLGALLETARALPEDQELQKAVRLASVTGLTAVAESLDGPLQRVLAQLARCQRSGAPAGDVVRSMLEAEIAADRNRRIKRARTLPVRLMIPVALLVLPGLILLLYAPSLMDTWEDLTSPFR